MCPEEGAENLTLEKALKRFYFKNYIKNNLNSKLDNFMKNENTIYYKKHRNKNFKRLYSPGILKIFN